MKKKYNYKKDKISGLILPQSAINDLELKRFSEELDKELLNQQDQDNERFETYYKSLYDKLYKRFEIEFDSLHTIDSKYDFLVELMNTIIKANHDMKHNYSVSELVEDSEKELRGLFSFFENKIQGLYPHKKAIEPNSNQNKRGRKEAQIKEAKEYLKGFYTEEQKIRFILELKNQYQNSAHKIFNLVIRVLIDSGYLEVPEKIALKTSFEKALGRKKQSPQNFNKQITQELRGTIEYENISKNIRSIIDNSFTS